MIKPLYILIGCDCDHDRLRFNKKIDNDTPSWEGYLGFYKYFNEVRSRVYSETGLEPAITLFIRGDSFTYMKNGAYDYCFRLFEDHLLKDYDKSDEIAWHHHQYRLNNGRWEHEFDDNDYIKKHIIDSFEEIKHYNIRTIHTGTCFQNTVSMNAFNDIGIQIDCSGLPGMRIEGTYNRYDYMKLKANTIYIPSRTDYQKVDQNNQNSIYEVPMTTVKHNLFNYVSFMNIVIKKREFQKKLLYLNASYFQITVNPLLFRIFINRVFKNYPDLNYFATFFHADELLRDKYKSRKTLPFYSRKNIKKNILYLIDLAKERNRLIRFINYRNFAKIIPGMHGIYEDSEKKYKKNN